MDCGSTGTALDGVADWSVLGAGLAGVGCTAARLDFFREVHPEQLMQLPWQKDCGDELSALGAY